MSRILELYAGIGGLAAAVGDRAEIVAAIDQNQVALSVYRHNFPSHRVLDRNISGLEASKLRELDADLWWLSPPCRPFTDRGKKADLEDSRTESLVHLIQMIPVVRPKAIALENVPGFAGSRAEGLLVEALEASGYRIARQIFCPTERGVPNRRRRYYLMASLEELAPFAPPSLQPRRLSDYLEAAPPKELEVPADLERQYRGALDIVEANAEDACTACFASSYGRTIIRSGSYLRTSAGLRRFTPREILALLQFPQTFTLPDSLSLRQKWSLVGNSLSLLAVQAVLASCRI